MSLQTQLLRGLLALPMLLLLAMAGALPPAPRLPGVAQAVPAAAGTVVVLQRDAAVLVVRAAPAAAR